MTDPPALFPERSALLSWLADAVRASAGTGSGAALALVDVDAFGAVIETLGMACSDVVLQTLGGRLQESAERVGARLARAGDDEFAVVLPVVDDAAAARRTVADVVGDAFGTSLAVSGQTLYLTASAGVAVSPPDDPQELLRRATVALGRIKSAGGGRTAVYEPLPSTTAGRLALHAELHDALRHEQLSAYYQPIVDVTEMRVVGIEALVRWLHPDRGVLTPTDFLPWISGTPLVEELGFVMLRQACIDTALLSTQVRDLSYVAVNIAPRQLTDRTLPERVLAELEAAGLPPERLVLEIAEVARVEDQPDAHAVIADLHAHGIRITMDDFGTGYATLATLRRLRLDMLKIGQTYVAGLGRSDEDATVVASVVSLARAMGIETVANGVETAEQAAAVLALGCRLAQGHRWSPAVPLADLPDVIERISRDGHRRPRRPRALPGGPVENRRIVEMHESGASAQTIAAALNRAGLHTSGGARWHAAQVQRVLDAAHAEDQGSV